MMEAGKFFYHLKNLPDLPETFIEEALTAEYEHIKFPISYSANSMLFRQTKFYNILFQKFGYVDAKFLKVPGNTIYNWHIDRGRKCSLNWPIITNPKAITIFKESLEREHVFKFEEVDYTTMKPTLLNTVYPHCVINRWPTDRIVLSISVHGDSPYEDLKSFLETLQINEY